MVETTGPKEGGKLLVAAFQRSQVCCLPPQGEGFTSFPWDADSSWMTPPAEGSICFRDQEGGLKFPEHSPGTPHTPGQGSPGQCRGSTGLEAGREQAAPLIHHTSSPPLHNSPFPPGPFILGSRIHLPRMSPLLEFEVGLGCLAHLLFRRPPKAARFGLYVQFLVPTRDLLCALLCIVCMEQ